jgi:hypothetical protein
MTLQTVHGHSIAYANASEVVAVNRAPTARSLLKADAMWLDPDSGCLYWDAAKTGFDPDRMELLQTCSLFDPKTCLVVYLRPPRRGTALPMDTDEVRVIDCFTKKEIHIRIVHRLQDNNGTKAKARKTECAIVTCLSQTKATPHDLEKE